MRKKQAIILFCCIFFGIIIFICLRNSNVSYSKFIEKNFSDEFIQKTSDIQKLIRTEILEKPFAVVNSEGYSIEDLKISEECEEVIFQKLSEVIIYIEMVECSNLSDSDSYEFENFREISIRDLNELYDYIDNYNESITGETIVNSNYYFDLQKKLTSPLETVNSYIVMTKTD